MRSPMFSGTSFRTKNARVASSLSTSFRKLHTAIKTGIVINFKGRPISKIFEAIRFHQPFMVMRMVIRSCHKNKIAQVIVGTYAVQMMDNFIGSKWTPKFLGHNQDVFRHVSCFVGIWMLWHQNGNISLCNSTATFPVGIRRAAPRSFWSAHNT